jgi:hypothetical protein
MGLRRSAGDTLSQTKACASRWGEILEFHTLQNHTTLNQVSYVNFSQK